MLAIEIELSTTTVDKSIPILDVEQVRATPTLTSHLSLRLVPKLLSSWADGWARDGLVCCQGEAQQLLTALQVTLVSTFKAGSTEE